MKIPKIGVCIGLTALGFQTTVLYPWHNKIDNRLAKIEEILKNKQ